MTVKSCIEHWLPMLKVFRWTGVFPFEFAIVASPLLSVRGKVSSNEVSKTVYRLDKIDLGGRKIRYISTVVNYYIMMRIMVCVGAFVPSMFSTRTSTAMKVNYMNAVCLMVILCFGVFNLRRHHSEFVTFLTNWHKVEHKIMHWKQAGIRPGAGQLHECLSVHGKRIANRLFVVQLITYVMTIPVVILRRTSISSFFHLDDILVFEKWIPVELATVSYVIVSLETFIFLELLVITLGIGDLIFIVFPGRVQRCLKTITFVCTSADFIQDDAQVVRNVVLMYRELLDLTKSFNKMFANLVFVIISTGLVIWCAIFCVIVRFREDLSTESIVMLFLAFAVCVLRLGTVLNAMSPTTMAAFKFKEVLVQIVSKQYSILTGSHHFCGTNEVLYFLQFFQPLEFWSGEFYPISSTTSLTFLSVAISNIIVILQINY